MLNGNGLIGNASSTQSSIIIPFPGDTAKYYIFTTGDDGGSGLAYSVVDVTLNGGLGAITTKNVSLNTTAAEKLTAVSHCNGTDYWVVVTDQFNNNFNAYLITNIGVSGAVTSSIGSSNIYPRTLGYMKISPNGKKLAKAYYYFGTGGPLGELFDFNNLTGIVSNPIPLNFPYRDQYCGTYGVEFSSDNNKLYYQGKMETQIFGTICLFQFDISTNNSAIINSSRILIDSTLSKETALQLGSDGKIYSNGLYSLDRINSPNSLGLSCNFQKNSFLLSPNYSGLGLPNFVTSFFNPINTGCFPIIDIPSPVDTISLIEMPNIFTPNDDAANDFFKPIIMKGIKKSTLVIYNRWGQKLFETDNIAEGWDGKLNGRICTAGIYYWIINYYDINAKNISASGFLSLFK